MHTSSTNALLCLGVVHSSQLTSLVAPDPKKKGLGNLNTKNLTAAGILAAPIKSRHVKSVMSHIPLTIFSIS